jgi:hypothetical protein
MLPLRNVLPSYLSTSCLENMLTAILAPLISRVASLSVPYFWLIYKMHILETSILVSLYFLHTLFAEALVSASTATS